MFIFAINEQYITINKVPYSLCYADGIKLVHFLGIWYLKHCPLNIGILPYEIKYFSRIMRLIVKLYMTTVPKILIRLY